MEEVQAATGDATGGVTGDAAGDVTGDITEDAGCDACDAWGWTSAKSSDGTDNADSKITVMTKRTLHLH